MVEACVPPLAECPGTFRAYHQAQLSVLLESTDRLFYQAASSASAIPIQWNPSHPAHNPVERPPEQGVFAHPVTLYTGSKANRHAIDKVPVTGMGSTNKHVPGQAWGSALNPPAHHFEKQFCEYRKGLADNGCIENCDLHSSEGALLSRLQEAVLKAIKRAIALSTAS